MGFFDKVKNMFTEEVEEDDVKVQKIKKDVTHVPIESPASDEKNISEEYNFNGGMSFSKPIFFDEDDFEDLNLTDKKEEIKPKKTEIKKEEPKKEEIRPIYVGNTSLEPEEKKVFKPTPIISPVYGVLDKNYHKEDIINRSEISLDETKEDSVDSVRNKAYGTLEDELENTLFGNSILFKKEEDEEEPKDVEFEEIDEDSISSLTEDVGKELDKLMDKKKKSTKKTKKEKSVSKEEDDDDLLGFIDSTLYKDGDEE